MHTLDSFRWRFLAVLHFIVGFTALLGGGSLVVWWDGSMLKLPITLLESSPFHDFLLPGLILYGAVGVHNLIACFLVAKREPGAEVISFSAGSALLIWLVVQAVMISSTHWLQYGYGALAAVIILNAAWARKSRDGRHFSGSHLAR